MLILFEDMNEKFNAILEAVVTTRHALEEKIEQVRAELKSDIDVLKAVARQHSDDIRELRRAVDEMRKEILEMRQDIRRNSQDIQRTSEDIQRNSEDIRQLGGYLDKKADRAELLLLQHRVSAVERPE